MTLSYSQAKVLYAGNGQTTKWDIPFAFLNTADLQITKINANGESEVLQNDFNIDLQEHAVFYPMPGSQTPPLAQGEKLLICRHTPLTQQTDFQAQQSFDPSVLEEGYDKAMMIAQEQAEVLARAVKFPAQESPSSTDAAVYLKNLEKTLQQAQQANDISQEVISAAGQASQTASEAVNKAAETVSQLNAYVVSAQEAANFAQKWAVQTDSEVAPGQGYGAKKYALDAAAYNTQTQEGSAQAQTAAAQAAQNAQQALASQTAAQEAAATAQSARQEIEQAQENCSASALEAQNSAQQAAQSAQQAAQSIVSKANVDLSNGTKATQESINNIMPNTMDYVVESYKDASGNWYRKHKSGWVEQGGICAGSGGTISLLTPFSGTDYLVMGNVRLTYQRGSSGDGGGAILCYPNSASSFYMAFAARNFGDIGQQKVSWIACGQGA